MAFLRRNPNIRVAHNMHVPMQVLRAVRLGIPCAVLIREPLSNLTSLVIAGENDVSHELAFRVYIDYYRRVATVRDQVVVCTFAEVLDDPSVVARRLNELYGTAFRANPMGTEEKISIVEWLEDHQRDAHTRPGHGTVPNAYKERRKPDVRKELERHRLLPEAKAVYREFALHSPDQGDPKREAVHRITVR